MGKLGLVSRLPISADELFHYRDEYIQNRHLITWNFYHPDNSAQQVDIIINYDLSDHSTKNIMLPAVTVKILNIHDLIEMKSQSGRAQDLLDIEALKNLQSFS